mgnify:CR=1 FL=1
MSAAKSGIRKSSATRGGASDGRPACAAVARQRLHHQVSVPPSVGLEDARDDSLHGPLPACSVSCWSANMRLLGWMRNAPLEGFHRLLPWGVWGFVANAVTGMMFFIGQAFQYIENPAFHWKMLCILLAGADVLYLTWHDEIWEMGPGDTAPLIVKVLAASQIFLWVGVIYFGRMLPYSATPSNRSGG